MVAAVEILLVDVVTDFLANRFRFPRCPPPACYTFVRSDIPSQRSFAQRIIQYHRG